jgi:hypothetical protein
MVFAEILVAHQDRAVVRVGDAYIKVETDHAKAKREQAILCSAPVPVPEVLWWRPGNPSLLALARVSGDALTRSTARRADGEELTDPNERTEGHFHLAPRASSRDRRGDRPPGGSLATERSVGDASDVSLGGHLVPPNGGEGAPEAVGESPLAHRSPGRSPVK